MITFEDCVGMCGLDAAQIAAISEHEHVPEMAATALASYLLHRAGGADRIGKMLVEDVQAALHSGDVVHAAELLSSLRHFLEQHSEARISVSNPQDGLAAGNC
jgi:hypothetical protein